MTRRLYISGNILLLEPLEIIQHFLVESKIGGDCETVYVFYMP